MVVPLTAATVLGNIKTGVDIASAFGSMFGGGGSSAAKLDGKRTRRMEARYAAKVLPSLQVYGWKKAGIHPLAGIGLNPASGVQDYYRGGADEKSISDMGQNLSRAIGATVPGAHEKQMQELAVERAQLENEMLKTQITNVGSQAGDPPRVETLDDQNIASMHNDRGLTAGSIKPPPAGKKFTVGSTPYGDITMVLPPSGQADEFGEIYGAVKGMEYMAKRGLVYYKNGVYRLTKKGVNVLLKEKKRRKEPKKYKSWWDYQINKQLKGR